MTEASWKFSGGSPPRSSVRHAHTKSPSSSLRLQPEMGLVDLADPSLAAGLAGKVSEQLEVFATQMRQELLPASVSIGLNVMGELIDAEATDAVGTKGRHDKDRTAYRQGAEDGKVTLGGRRIPVPAPGAHGRRRQTASSPKSAWSPTTPSRRWTGWRTTWSPPCWPAGPGAATSGYSSRSAHRWKPARRGLRSPR